MAQHISWSQDCSNKSMLLSLLHRVWKLYAFLSQTPQTFISWYEPHLIARKDVILVVCNKLFKITYFVVTTKGILVKELVKLSRDNIWKLHELLESVVLDQRLRPQFVTELMRKLNRMLEIKTKLSISFHPQTDEQIEQINQKLE